MVFAKRVCVSLGPEHARMLQGSTLDDLMNDDDPDFFCIIAQGRTGLLWMDTRENGLYGQQYLTS